MNRVVSKEGQSAMCVMFTTLSWRAINCIVFTLGEGPSVAVYVRDAVAAKITQTRIIALCTVIDVFDISFVHHLLIPSLQTTYQLHLAIF